MLELDGEPTARLPYRKRRALLVKLGIEDGRLWRTTPVSDDGYVLFNLVRERGLEGMVAKRLDEPYLPGERRWVKTKNRAYWRYPHEIAALQRRASGSKTAKVR